MKEYIRRSDACAEVDRGDLLVGDNASWAKECINRTPGVDVAEIKHGYWIPIREPHQSDDCFWTESFLQCSLCQYKRRVSFINSEPDFCEGCGADMKNY